MPEYRRNYVEGGTYFFTVVTLHRQHLFIDEPTRVLLREAISHVRVKHPFQIEAMVLLPEHLHAVVTLPPNDADYSTRWGLVKEKFTRTYLASGGRESGVSSSRQRHRERNVWQRRFWEHTVRDEDDLARCMDYVHWNPVKHGLVVQVCDYPHSTFHRFVKEGLYPVDWGGTAPPDVIGAEWE